MSEIYAKLLTLVIEKINYQPLVCYSQQISYECRDVGKKDVNCPGKTLSVDAKLH